jgi:hypothetical protein
MRTILILTALAVLSSCEAQSGIARKSVEGFQSTPTPAVSPSPAETPIDPAEIITAATNAQGETITVNGPKQTKTVTCSKFNRVVVNHTDNVVTIKGACRQIMINGNRNDVTAEAALEIVVNGSENTVRYSYFVNGIRPTITEGASGNTIEKVKK